MKREPQCYGLLVGASLYEKHELKRLSGTSRDLAIMKSALIHGLKFNADNIRTLGEDGSVRALSFARALSEFESMTMKEDTFVLYFTGHGMPYGLCFTDETVNIQSIVDFIERLPASRKIVILDCCFSGDMKISGVHEMTFEETAAAFAGRGIAVMASSAPDERSWLSKKGDASLYTCIVASALTSRRSIHEGNISLNDINDEVRYLMQMWNGEHPDRKQLHFAPLSGHRCVCRRTLGGGNGQRFNQSLSVLS